MKSKQGGRVMTNLYLDIDGVLLGKEHSIPEGLLDFLKFVTENFNCYWLTTHCSGDTNQPFLYLVGKWPTEAIPFLEKIEPTKWRLLKTEAINFNQDFFWLEDFPFEAEQKILKDRGVSDSLIIVDLDKNPTQLIDFVKNLLK